MTIDINELRRLTVDCYWPTSPVSINELLDRLEAAEKECESWKGLAKQFGNEADVCATHLYFAKDELNRLRARIEEMERQEPVAQVGVHKTGGNAGIAWSARPLNEFDSLPPLCDGDKLYLNPGAQPAPIIPEGWKLVPIEPTPKMMRAAQKADHDHGNHEEWLEYDGEDVKRVYRAMLASTPEANP